MQFFNKIDLKNTDLFFKSVDGPQINECGRFSGENIHRLLGQHFQSQIALESTGQFNINYYIPFK